VKSGEKQNGAGNYIDFFSNDPYDPYPVLNWNICGMWKIEIGEKM
jgi:hypothetical protein